MNKITPECANLGKSLKMSGMVVIILAVIGTILCIVGVVYSQMNTTKDKDSTRADSETDEDKDKKKKKVTLWMYIGAIVVLVIGCIASVWNMTIGAKTTKTCIGE